MFLSLQAAQAWCVIPVSTHRSNFVQLVTWYTAGISFAHDAPHVVLMLVVFFMLLTFQSRFSFVQKSTCWVAVWADCNLKLCSQGIKKLAGGITSLFSLVSSSPCYGPNRVATKVSQIKTGIGCHFQWIPVKYDRLIKGYIRINKDNRVLSSHNKSSFPAVIHCSLRMIGSYFSTPCVCSGVRHMETQL